ncbi:transcriptional regulator, partial [Streptomyces sp. T-3]|nr:transcriptional regulator [Streptomyces sp. T-3]
EVARMRRRLGNALRGALIARGDPQLLADWAYSAWGEDDLGIWQALVDVLPHDAPERAPARTRLMELDAEQSASAATWLQPPRP